MYFFRSTPESVTKEDEPDESYDPHIHRKITHPTT